MDQGVAALAGAVIGGAAAALAAVIAGRSARHQARSQERMWRNQTRREIYTSFYAALDSAVDAAWPVSQQAYSVLMRAELGRDEALQQIAEESTPERQEERNEALRRIEALHPLSVTVSFEGPSSVRDIATELPPALRGYVSSCVQVAAPRDGQPPAQEHLSQISAHLSSSRNRLVELANRFLSETTRVLDGETAP